MLCALHSIHVLNIHQSGCNAVRLLHSWCHMKLLLSLQVLHRQYNRAPVYSVTIESHKCRRHMCSAVTCYLHFWQNVRHLLRATAVTQEWNRNQNKSQSQKVDPGEENYPAAPARDQSCALLIMSQSLYH